MLWGGVISQYSIFDDQIWGMWQVSPPKMVGFPIPHVWMVCMVTNLCIHGKFIAPSLVPCHFAVWRILEAHQLVFFGFSKLPRPKIPTIGAFVPSFGMLFGVTMSHFPVLPRRFETLSWPKTMRNPHRIDGM